ncbi:hypothetical protein EYR41_002150 [Orbilia oligospora]|uniref:Uncharacterized protein n=1 Tax=Orbilia oligospora TaxID=2813651 RepID=A0A8H2HV04_ORBOL|nr:hypothetical protein EYR41_002150 [Orbilia oligospora]
MTSRKPRAPVLPLSATATAAEAGALNVIPDIRDIERKQQAAEELLDQGKVTEGSALAQEVALDLQVYRGTLQNTFVPFDELFSRAVDGGTKVDGEAHDLQLAGPQFERLAKKIRVTAQVLEAVYQDCIKNAAAAQKDQYARYYHAFCFPVSTEFRELGLRFQLGEAEEEETNEGGH